MKSPLKALVLISLTTLGLAACQTAPKFQPESIKAGTISIQSSLSSNFRARYRGINPFTNGDASIATTGWDLNTQIVAGMSNTLSQAGYQVQSTGGRYTLNVEPATYKDYVFGLDYEQISGYGVYRRYNVIEEGVAVYAAYQVTITDTTSGKVVDTRYGQFSNRVGLENWPEFYWKNNQQGFPVGVEDKFKMWLSNHFNTVNPMQLNNVHPDSNKIKRRHNSRL